MGLMRDRKCSRNTERPAAIKGGASHSETGGRQAGGLGAKIIHEGRSRCALLVSIGRSVCWAVDWLNGPERAMVSVVCPNAEERSDQLIRSGRGSGIEHGSGESQDAVPLFSGGR